jgi:hypothetical protein
MKCSRLHASYQGTTRTLCEFIGEKSISIDSILIPIPTALSVLSIFSVFSVL